MSSSTCFMLLLVALALPASETASAETMEAIYRKRCAACHESVHADLPGRAQLAKLHPRKIVEKLTNGTMQINAAGLSRAQIEALSIFLGRSDAGAAVEN